MFKFVIFATIVDIVRPVIITNYVITVSPVNSAGITVLIQLSAF